MSRSASKISMIASRSFSVRASWRSTQVSALRSQKSQPPSVATRARGTIDFGVGLQSGPAGYPPDDHDGVNAVGCADQAGLVARVAEDGAVIPLGEGAWLLAPRPGQLALGPNDRNLADTSGAFTVEPDPGHGRRARPRACSA